MFQGVSGDVVELVLMVLVMLILIRSDGCGLQLVAHFCACVLCFVFFVWVDESVAMRECGRRHGVLRALT